MRQHKCAACGAIVGKKSASISWFPDKWKVVTEHGEINLKGNLEYKIFNFLWSNQNVFGLTGSIMLDRIFENSYDGGYSLSALRQRMFHLRKQIAPIGLIITKGNGGGSGYQLKLTMPEKAMDFNIDLRSAPVLAPV